METVVIENKLPAEFQDLHDALYKKISSMVGGNLSANNIMDPDMIKIIIISAMTIVEKLKNDSGGAYSGPEKKKIVLMLIKTVMNDLAKNGKVTPEIAKLVNENIDTWGGLAIDVAVAAGNRAFDIGQRFVQDVEAGGCISACKKDCCCCIM